ncbi:MAG: septal ring lytic transglycosylase RlpA family protein [Syntrophales bacterium]
MKYEIQKGDPISQVTKLLGVSWNEFRKLNPHAVAQSRNTGKWYIKEGKTVEGPGSFQSKLNEAQGEVKAPPSSQNVTNNQWIEYTVKPGDTVWKLSREKFHIPVDMITKDNGLLNPRTLQVGQKLRIRVESSLAEKKDTVVASWYGEQYHGKVMSNGKPYDMHKDTIAHRDLPLGTRVQIENPATGKVVEATVTDRGPFVSGRDIDLSYGLAKKLSVVEKGISKLLMKKI